MTAVVLSVSIWRSDRTFAIQCALPANRKPSCRWLLFGFVFHFEDLRKSRFEHWVLDQELFAAVIENLLDYLAKLGHVTFTQLCVHSYPVALNSHWRTSWPTLQFPFSQTSGMIWIKEIDPPHVPVIIFQIVRELHGRVRALASHLLQTFHLYRSLLEYIFDVRHFWSHSSLENGL